MASSKAFLFSSIAIPFATFMAAQPTLAQSDDASNKPYEFDAGVTVSVQATDNVFLTANDRRSDFVTVLSPWMGLSYRAEDFRLSLEASSAIARFADYAQEDYEDYFLGAAKTITVEGRHKGSLSCDYLRLASTSEVQADVAAKEMETESGAKVKGKVDITGRQ